MTRTRLILLGGVGALAGLIANLPLSVALPLFGARNLGVTAKAVTGTIWTGGLWGLNVAGVRLGDTGVGLLALPLVRGQADLEFIAPTLRGFVRATPGTLGLRDATGTLDAARFATLPLARFDLDDASATFDGQRCVSAQGRVRATLSGRIGDIELPGGLSGPLRCEGGALLMPLVSQSAMERLTLRLTGDGAWRGDLILARTEPTARAALIAAGFREGQGGLTLRLSGRL